MERIRISKSNAVPLLHVIPLISLVKDQVSNLNSRRRLFMQTNSCRTFYSKKVSIRSSIQIKDYLWHQLQVTPLLKRNKSTSRPLRRFAAWNPRRSLRWLVQTAVHVAPANGLPQGGSGLPTGFDIKIPYQGCGLPKDREDFRHWVEYHTVYHVKPTFKPSILARSYRSVWWVYLRNRPQVSVGYKLINHAGCW